MDNQVLQEIVETAQLLRGEGEVVEVRILNTKKKTINGYFDDPFQLAEAVTPYIGKYDIYFTLNPVSRDLLSRAKNRLQEYSKQTTTDKDIERLDFILIDLDPIRPSGISSTDEEHTSAGKMAKRIASYLERNGFPQPCIADSGNGYHILYHTELANCEENVALLKTFLQSLDFHFSDDKVQVDCTTYNPGRIVKLYGTTACKGDDTKERPHRRSRIVRRPEEWEPVTRELLETFTKKVSVPDAPKASKGTEKFDLEAWMEEKGLQVAFKAPFHGKGTKYILDVCPWNSDHTNRSAYVVQFAGGGLAAGCHHNGCKSENWQSLRSLLDPDWRKRNRWVKGARNNQTS